MKVPGSVKSISFMSLFLNMSMTIVFSYFAIYQHDVLHLDLSKIGFLEGLVNLLSYLTRLLSGYLSDVLCNRKILIIIGSIFILISRPLISHCDKLLSLFGARTLERLGNGLQSTPRDALVSDWTDKKNHHMCFGFKASMAYIGSVIGAILASCLFYYFRDFQKVFWCSCIPAAIAVFIVIFFVKNKYKYSNTTIIPNITKKTHSHKK